MWKQAKVDWLSEKNAIFNDLITEVSNWNPGARLSFALRNKLEKYPLEVRKEIVNRVADGCSPLFKACKFGRLEVVEYLIHTCGADIEQKGIFEVHQDRSTHIVTPLWCAAVSGKLSIVELLVDAGANINAVSDSGSTPIRSACFMTHFEVVQYLVQHGAEINTPNFNRGTCLINSVQSAKLCQFLLENGADVNAKDIQNKTALHYSIQEHRLETTKLLLEYGANYNAKSRYGDDALQMACLKGANEVFEYLTVNINYSPERIANAHELMGATFLDEHNGVSKCMHHWRISLKIRNEHNLHPKIPEMGLQEAYRYQKEFETEDELLAMSGDLDKIRIQSLLVAERILGSHHKDTIFRLMYRGAYYADVARYQRCIELWRRVLKIRIEKDTVLYTDTCFAAQALVKLMMDYNIKSVLNNIDNTDKRFHDIVETFILLVTNLVEMRPLMMIRPQYKRQLDFFEKILRSITHLIYLMLETAQTETNKDFVDKLLMDVISSNIKCIVAGDSILHLCVSRYNTVKSSYFLDQEPIIIFPCQRVLKKLLHSGANINAKNNNGRTPLHVATMPYNYTTELAKFLLDHGSHLDQPDRLGDTPLDAICRVVQIAEHHSMEDLPLINYTSLKCMCATKIVKFKIHFENQLPRTLENFVKSHLP